MAIMTPSFLSCWTQQGAAWTVALATLKAPWSHSFPAFRTCLARSSTTKNEQRSPFHLSWPHSVRRHHFVGVWWVWSHFELEKKKANRLSYFRITYEFGLYSVKTQYFESFYVKIWILATLPEIPIINSHISQQMESWILLNSKLKMVKNYPVAPCTGFVLVQLKEIGILQNFNYLYNR